MLLLSAKSVVVLPVCSPAPVEETTRTTTTARGDTSRGAADAACTYPPTPRYSTCNRLLSLTYTFRGRCAALRCAAVWQGTRAPSEARSINRLSRISVEATPTTSFRRGIGSVDRGLVPHWDSTHGITPNRERECPGPTAGCYIVHRKSSGRKFWNVISLAESFYSLIKSILAQQDFEPIDYYDFHSSPSSRCHSRLSWLDFRVPI